MHIDTIQKGFIDFKQTFVKITQLALPMALSYTFSFSIVAIGVICIWTGLLSRGKSRAWRTRVSPR